MVDCEWTTFVFPSEDSKIAANAEDYSQVSTASEENEHEIMTSAVAFGDAGFEARKMELGRPLTPSKGVECFEGLRGPSHGGKKIPEGQWLFYFCHYRLNISFHRM